MLLGGINRGEMCIVESSVEPDLDRARFEMPRPRSRVPKCCAICRAFGRSARNWKPKTCIVSSIECLYLINMFKFESTMELKDGKGDSGALCEHWPGQTGGIWQSRLWPCEQDCYIRKVVFMSDDYSINASVGEFTAETPLIAKRSVTEKGTPKNIGYILSAVYFVLRTYLIGIYIGSAIWSHGHLCPRCELEVGICLATTDQLFSSHLRLSVDQYVSSLLRRGSHSHGVALYVLHGRLAVR